MRRRAQPNACHHDADRLLRRWGFVPREIVRVYPDAILFVSHDGQPRTAWLTVIDDGCAVRVRPGFEAARY